MSDSNSSKSSGGIGLLGCLFLVFLVLKLTGHIDWSWWYVTMPLWGPFALVFGILAIVGVIWLVAAGLKAVFSSNDKKKRKLY